MQPEGLRQKMSQAFSLEEYPRLPRALPWAMLSQPFGLKNGPRDSRQIVGHGSGETFTLPPHAPGTASPSRTARTTWSWRNGLNSTCRIPSARAFTTEWATSYPNPVVSATTARGHAARSRR